MATLLNYKSRRTPMQNSAIAFIVLIVSLVAFGALPTQWFAAKYHYDKNLGEGLLDFWGVVIYSPIDWVVWGVKLGDVPQLRESVHTMAFLGAFGALGAMLLAVVVSHRLGRYSKGMEGLHGTAHFAERDEIDLTGFINGRAHKSKGVVVGSVMFDKKGKVIHPHHPKFAHRYRKHMIRGPGMFGRVRRVQKRDKEGRPLFLPRKSVVKAIEVLRDGANTHIFGFCPTRSGKGTGMVIPTLLTWNQSVFVNDPKGEAWALTSGFRKHAGQEVIKFEPDCQDGSGARWNALDEIRIFTPNDVSDSQMIMAMACDPLGEGLPDYFDKAAYEFMTALGLHVRYMGRDGSLAGCANFLGDPNWDNDKQMYTEMMQAIHDPEGKMGWVDSNGKSIKTHPMIANGAKGMLNKEDKDRSGVLSTAKAQLSLYLNPIVAQNTSCSDFLVRDLMTGEKPVSLYYVVAPSAMSRLTPLTRLFYELFIRRNASDMEFENGQSKKNYTFSMLMIIDEAASLKKLPVLQEALGYVAGYGIRMFILVQDIAQIEDLYGQNQTIDSGAETRIAYSPNKIGTAELLARMTGKTTVTEEGANLSHEMLGIKPGSVSISTNKIARDLVTADEFLSLSDQDMIVFVKGKPPIYGRKAFYYEDPILLGRASMKPPEQSAKLRQTDAKWNPVSVVAPATQEAVLHDKWQASRQALKDNVATSQPAQPQAEYTGTERRESASEAPTPARPKRRYADQVQTISAEERREVQRLVADSVVVDEILKVDAF